MSLVHFASFGGRGSFETIVEPFVGLEEELIARRETGRSWRKTKRDRRDVGAMMAVMIDVPIAKWLYTVKFLTGLKSSEVLPQVLISC